MKSTSNTGASSHAVAHSFVNTPAEREIVPLLEGESFRWIEHDYPSKIARWVYHPEVEIHLIRESSGSYIIGDQVGAFSPGQVSIVGSKLPHDWMSDLSGNEVVVNRDAVIQFTPEWLRKTIQVMPELSSATDLIEAAKRGIIYTGDTEREAGRLIECVGSARGLSRVSHFFELLQILILAPESEKIFVTRESYSPEAGNEGKAAVEAGLAYILENLSGHIRMSEAARLALMSEPSFSRYFKKASGMTFSTLVGRLRISSACRLLSQTDAPIAQVSTEVGYRNLANFNRQFLKEMAMTPGTYRKLSPSERQAQSPLVAFQSDEYFRTYSQS